MWVQGLLRISWKDTAQGPRPGSFCGWWSLAALVRTLWMLRLTTAAPFLLSILPRLCRPTEWHWQLSIADAGAVKPCLPCTLPSAPGASQPAAPTQTSGDPPAADLSQMRVTRNIPLMCMAQMELWAFPQVLLPLSQVPLPAPALVWLDKCDQSCYQITCGDLGAAITATIPWLLLDGCSNCSRGPRDLQGPRLLHRRLWKVTALSQPAGYRSDFLGIPISTGNKKK